MLSGDGASDGRGELESRLDEMMQNQQAASGAGNQYVKTTQVIVSALSFGVLFFLAFAVLTRADRVDQPLDVVGIVAAVSAPLSLLGGLWAVRQFLTNVRRQILETESAVADSETEIDQETVIFAKALQTSTVIICGALEAAAMLNLILLVVSGNSVHLAVAVGLLFALATQFPTLSRAESWITNQRRLLDELRQAKSL